MRFYLKKITVADNYSNTIKLLMDKHGMSTTSTKYNVRPDMYYYHDENTNPTLIKHMRHHENHDQMKKIEYKISHIQI